ncbi:hypothetical protein IFM89_039523 [Coptis chinensis]|uniref:Omega-hydroxypalmitate O-feruloyl transferase n=1 Tax=Coptis chinensis TaxID=261450 RepID=A0A835LH90_9MAGN|nr:hypothetical protein IFM89_039523 [Coptis chinensis]
MTTLSQGLLFPYHHHNVSHPKLRPCAYFTTFSNPRIFRQLKSSKMVPPSRPRCQSIQRSMRPSAILETMDQTVTIHSTSLVLPIEETERKSVFLSNIDKSLNFKASTIYFFSSNPNFSIENIVAKLENAYRKVLVQYDFLAGRLRWNSEQGRIEIDCNAAGAGFVVASCGLSFEELGGIGSLNIETQQFALRKWNASPEDQPLFVMQVTSFRCGGFALGFALNHVTMDGICSKIFLENLASLLSGNDLVLPPYNDRRLLAARSPPRIAFPHTEMFNFESLQGNKSSKMLLKATFQKLNSQYFRLSLDDINNLKRKASEVGGDNIAHTSGFSAVTAHIWQCVAQAKNPENDLEKSSTILYAVNIRSRVRPRLPSSYAGNAIVSAYATTTCSEMKKRPFSHLVQMVSEGDTRITDEYVKSILDWSELHKGFPYGDAIISSWWNMGLNEIDYPWGRPKWSCPVVPNHGNNAITLIPEVEGKEFKGLHVLVSLPQLEMEKFQGLFYELL